MDMNGIIGRKLGMTRLFDADGRVTPVTVIEAGPCTVLRVRPAGETGEVEKSEKPQRLLVQLGFGARKPKRATRALLGHGKAAGLDTVPAVLREFSMVSSQPSAPAPPTPGATVTVSIFQPGDWVKVTGTTKGRGFQGVVKRHGFGGGPATHGNTRHRKPGSIGPGTDPSRVIKGKKLPGHMGAARHTEVALRVVKVDPERNLIFIKGAVPGPMKGIIAIRRQQNRSRYA